MYRNARLVTSTDHRGALVQPSDAHPPDPRRSLSSSCIARGHTSIVMSAKAQTEKEKGNEAFKAGDFPKAIGHYTAAFIADPSNPTYSLNRAAAYLKLGKNEDAERDCDAVLRLDSKNVKGLFRRGQARVAMQKLHEAEAGTETRLRESGRQAGASEGKGRSPGHPCEIQAGQFSHESTLAQPLTLSL
ncbi:hypothetical protein NUW54_g8131 [Trametes sanguinea]|uniref:Uncharacterized protein n=1 Tax=Trametes sanguinea TaxID=158606 RepID=A0ACC1PFM6_9APHY|nr:hypothetical protein NUW54_g8131 [Trametes sanguinea]